MLYLNYSRIILICQPDFKRINQLLEVVENKDKTALGTLSSIMIIAEVNSFSETTDYLHDFIQDILSHMILARVGKPEFDMYLLIQK